MNKAEVLRQLAIKSGIASGNATSIPMHKLESFSALLLDHYKDFIASELEKQPLNDTAQSIAIWIRELK